MSLWECKCGHVEEGDDSPEECMRCGRLDAFVEIAEGAAEDDDSELLDEMLSSKDMWRSKKK